jgi:hypothetical protein
MDFQLKKHPVFLERQVVKDRLLVSFFPDKGVGF